MVLDVQLSTNYGLGLLGIHIWNIVGEPDELQAIPSQALLINAIKRCQFFMFAYKPIIMFINPLYKPKEKTTLLLSLQNTDHKVNGLVLYLKCAY